MRTESLDAQALAEACAESLWRDDMAAKKLGMKIEKIAPGHASLSMTVTSDMANGHGTCHGGFMFALADSAFAFSCNTYNQRAVAQHCTISYLAPAFAGDALLACGKEVSRSGRNGIYDIRITNEQGDAIAEFRGYSRTVSGTLLGDKQ